MLLKSLALGESLVHFRGIQENSFRDITRKHKSPTQSIVSNRFKASQTFYKLGRLFPALHSHFSTFYRSQMEQPRAFEASKNIPRRPLHPTVQDISSTDILPCHDRYPLLVCCCPIFFNPFILILTTPLFFKIFVGKVPKFLSVQSGLPLFGVLQTALSKCSKRAGSEENDFGFPCDVIP
ncbi:hypothetical protein CEXT_643061 [Caerostris extrusa]|uniref:Uncharacterized protein n=1 Tax=Caerostris extrusa TaxID=172846 RepID=A0AAV4XLR1_CAEEX|nr:hypothetical protein CEXT_643061 [Caerostris extrusa]